MLKFSPSILAANFSRLSEEAHRMEQAGADLLHVDVMDGHFVPNITIGAPVVKCLAPETRLPLDVHLMIDAPETYLPDFIRAGSRLITFHLEAAKDPDGLIGLCRQNGVSPSVCIKPATPAEAVFPFLDRVDMVLVMTVEPGFGGQALIPGCLEKVRLIRQECDRRGLATDIEVDGGINRETIADAFRAGANVIVAGSAIFGAKDPAAVILDMRSVCEGPRRP